MANRICGMCPYSKPIIKKGLVVGYLCAELNRKVKDPMRECPLDNWEEDDDIY